MPEEDGDALVPHFGGDEGGVAGQLVGVGGEGVAEAVGGPRDAEGLVEVGQVVDQVPVDEGENGGKGVEPRPEVGSDGTPAKRPMAR